MSHKLIGVAVHRSPTRSWPDNLARVGQLVEFFKSIGVSNPSISRIGAYRDAFAVFSHAAESGERMSISESDAVIQTMVEFQQLSTIMDAAAATARNDQWLRQLKKLAKGAAFLTAENERPSARDTQFECYLAAVFKLSGLAAELAEPDVVVTYRGCKVGFAAKRPRSERSVEAKIRLGARQVQASGLPGIVAIDLTGVVARGASLMLPDRDASIQFVEAVVQSFIERESGRIEVLIGSRAIAVLFSLQVPTLIGIPHRPQLLTATCWRFLTLSRDSQIVRLVAEIAATCQRGLFGPVTEGEQPRVVKTV